MKIQTLFILLSFLCFSCQEEKTTDKPSWLSGTEEENLQEIAHQLGGFSKTMMEVSYRYSELYWAGQDENWKYAEHQLEHLVEALEAGLVRKPERANSAQEFLTDYIPEMQKAIENEDQEIFNNAFRSFTSGCNGCHAKENESFIQIKLPETRLSPVRF